MFLPQQADRLGDYKKRLRVTLYAPLFSGEEEIEVFNFLTQHTRACDDTGMYEGITHLLFRFNQKGVALASFETYHNSHRRGGVRGEDDIESYSDAIQWFLYTFTAYEILSEAFRRVNQMKHNQDEIETEFANRLRNETLRFGNILMKEI